MTSGGDGQLIKDLRDRVDALEDLGEEMAGALQAIMDCNLDFHGGSCDCKKRAKCALSEAEYVL